MTQNAVVASGCSLTHPPLARHTLIQRQHQPCHACLEAFAASIIRATALLSIRAIVPSSRPAAECLNRALAEGVVGLMAQRQQGAERGEGSVIALAVDAGGERGAADGGRGVRSGPLPFRVEGGDTPRKSREREGQ